MKLSKRQARKSVRKSAEIGMPWRIFMRQAGTSNKSNKDRISDQGKKLELRFPRGIAGESFCEVTNVALRTNNSSESATGAFASVLTIDLTKKLVTTGGDQITRFASVIADEEQRVMWQCAGCLRWNAG